MTERLLVWIENKTYVRRALDRNPDEFDGCSKPGLLPPSLINSVMAPSPWWWREIEGEIAGFVLFWLTPRMPLWHPKYDTRIPPGHCKDAPRTP